MNALLFAHVGIRSALLGFTILSKRSRLFATLIGVALLESGWRLFVSAGDPAAWLPAAALSPVAVTDFLLTAALVLAHRRKRDTMPARQAEALRLARSAGERAASLQVAQRMAAMSGSANQSGGDTLLRDLRALNRSAVAGPTPRKADITLARIGREVRLATPAGIQVRLDFADDLGPLLVNATALREALGHLGANAVAAMSKGGTLRIRASVNKIAAQNQLALTPGHWMRIEFSDTGDGMDEDALQRCLQPFYSTRPGAAGLGLATVQHFAQSAGGALEIDSEPKMGTTVTLWLPAAAPNERRNPLPAALAAFTPSL
ncbi:MAG: hypothetical protein KC502_14640 [Myxococcales bacterium]|nr:hypothetical protein [Myxococcales bacterium]